MENLCIVMPIAIFLGTNGRSTETNDFPANLILTRKSAIYTYLSKVTDNDVMEYEALQKEIP